MAVTDTKLAVFQVDVSKETGQVMLLIETGCGMRPVMGWPDISGMENFARVLLDICSHRKDNNERE
jgi:hypothetical protein